MNALAAITSALVAAHGLKPDEYDRILALIGREPSLTELGIFSAMWNEHCSYKSSKKWLRTLPTKGEVVIQGPGENAGVVDIGDGVHLTVQQQNRESSIDHALGRRGERVVLGWRRDHVVRLGGASEQVSGDNAEERP